MDATPQYPMKVAMVPIPHSATPATIASSLFDANGTNDTAMTPRPDHVIALKALRRLAYSASRDRYSSYAFHATGLCLRAYSSNRMLFNLYVSSVSAAMAEYRYGL